MSLHFKTTPARTRNIEIKKSGSLPKRFTLVTLKENYQNKLSLFALLRNLILIGFCTFLKKYFATEIILPIMTTCSSVMRQKNPIFCERL